MGVRVKLGHKARQWLQHNDPEKFASIQAEGSWAGEIASTHEHMVEVYLDSDIMVHLDRDLLESAG